MKKTICICAIAAFLLFGAGQATAAGRSYLELIPEKASITTGESLKVEIYYHPNGEKVDTIRVNLQFTPRILELENAAKDITFSITSGGNLLNNTQGYFSFGAGIPGGTMASGRFLSLRFKAVQPAEAKIAINPDSLVISDGADKYDGQAVSVSVNITGKPIIVLGAEKYLDGDLIRGAGGRIYLIINGYKKYLQNLAMLKKFGAGRPINNVDDAVLAAFKETSDPLAVNDYPSGTLLRAYNDKRIFVINNSYKKLISNISELQSYIGEKIIAVDNKTLNSYPYAVAAGLKTGSASRILAASTFKDGALIRSVSDKKIYIITQGKKKAVISLSELQKYVGIKINDVDASIVSSIPEYVAAADAGISASLMRDASNLKIYAVYQDKMKYVPNLAELANYSNKTIINVSSDKLTSYKLVSSLQL